MGLVQQTSTTAPWDLSMVSELAFSLTALHADAMSFDVSMRLWRLLGRTLHSAGNTTVKDLAEEDAAKLRAFGLAVRQLSSATVLAALRLAPDAALVEQLLDRLEGKPLVRLSLAANPSSQAVTSQ